MYKNYFKTAWRNLVRNKLFSVIKIFSLSIGLTVCMLIFLYSKDELSFDQFHTNKSELFRITQDWKMNNDPVNHIGVTKDIMGVEFAKNIPEIRQFVRVNGMGVTVKTRNGVASESPLFVDDNFLSVFTFPLIRGNSRSVLKDMYSVVLSENLAKKYFGTTDVIGKTMEIKLGDNFDRFKVSGVSENPPINSTLGTDMLLPFAYLNKGNTRGDDWIGGNLNTFLLLTPGANTKLVESKMQKIFDENSHEKIANAEREQGMKLSIKMVLQPFTAIHLSTEAGPDNGMQNGSKPVYSYVLTCIAVFILVIACINFINLAVAQSLKRSKEIGVRKVVGGTRSQLIRQFLTESFCVACIAFVIALCATAALLPFFNVLANKKLSLSYLSDGYLYAGYFVLLLITSFIAGFYPSLMLSAIQPVKALYSRQKLGGRNYLTKGLVVLQFALAIFLIIGTIAINSQLNYLSRADLGYDSKNLVRIDIPNGGKSAQQVKLFQEEIHGHPNIISSGGRSAGRTISGMKANGKTIIIEQNTIDEGFLPTYKVPVIAGRNFSPDHPSDSAKGIIVNETFLQEAGWPPDKAIGQTVTNMDGKQSSTIIGVIRNYHFTSLKEKIGAAVFRMQSDDKLAQVWVRINPENIPQTLSLFEKSFKSLVAFYPYSFQFMDDINAKNYETERKWKQIINIASALFVFISCIGLLGLVILSIEHRTKEIGVRKVLGAAVSRIVMLISKEFLWLIAIAFIIAVPAGYYAIHRWLQQFAYRIDIGWWMFALAGIAVIALALLTMSIQAFRAATANPVTSLKND